MAQLSTSPAVARVVTTGSPYAAILRLATPTVIAMLSQSIVNEVDAIFFAHLPAPESSNGQAALLPSLILLWVVERLVLPRLPRAARWLGVAAGAGARL